MTIRSLQATDDGIIVAETRDGGVHRRVIYFGASLDDEPEQVRAFAEKIGFGAHMPPPPPVPTRADFLAATSHAIEKAAIDLGYDSAASLVSYVTSSNPQWAAEAARFVVWRDEVWAHVFAELDAFEAGQRPGMTVAALMQGLPTIGW